MTEFGPIHQNANTAGRWTANKHLPVVSDGRANRSGHGRQTDRIVAGPQDAAWRANGFLNDENPLNHAIYSPPSGWLQYRATGPGDARSGGGAWLVSPGPTHHNQIAPPKGHGAGNHARPQGPRHTSGRNASGLLPTLGTTAELPKRENSEGFSRRLCAEIGG